MARNKTPESGDPHIFELSRTLQRFAASSRFNFLRSLQVGRFIDRSSNDTSLGVIEEFTFEKLIELGSKKLSKLRWLDAKQTQVLIRLLNGLSQSGGDSASTESGEEEESTISSVEAERKLREAITAYKSHPHSGVVSDRPLGAFWRKSWARSPFEEALTLSQLASLDLPTLLKKRTMTTKRIAMIAEAVESAVAEINKSAADNNELEDEVESLPEEVTHLRRSRTPQTNLHLTWAATVSDLRPEKSAAPTLFEVQLNAVPVGDDPTVEMFRTIIRTLSAEEFVELLDSDSVESSPSLEAARNKLSDALWSSHSAVLGIWKAALSAPGIDVKVLIQPLLELGFLAPAAHSGAAVVLSALGAVECSAFGVDLTGYWTLSPKLIEAALKQVISALPMAEADLLSTLGQILPTLPRVELLQALAEHTRNHEGIWKKSKK